MHLQSHNVLVVLAVKEIVVAAVVTVAVKALLQQDRLRLLSLGKC